MFYAHSLEDRPEKEWQPLAEHLVAVGERAAENGAKFGAAAASRLAGLLHDLGKYAPEFQRRLHGAEARVDHSTLGASVVIEGTRAEGARKTSFEQGFDRWIASLLAHAIAGHHAGLADTIGGLAALDTRLKAGAPAPDPVWRREIAPRFSDLWPGFDLSDVAGDPKAIGHRLAFLGRMIFATLVDADYRDTEAFYAAAEGRSVERDRLRLPEIVEDLIARLDAHMDGLRARSEDTAVNRLRAEILDHVRASAKATPGVFTLTVPTGGGKTLASLAFALDHARRHGLERIVYAIPFTSIVEQTADVFRSMLGDEVVLEHHAAIDEEKVGGREARDKIRLAMEDWAVPVVVTTNVQLFESLHSHRPSRCRRLHNLARAVIVLDEAQTIPLHVLKPCVAAIGELARNYGSSVVVCTATQPALAAETFHSLIRLDPARELAPDPRRLHRELTRVRLERVGDLDDEALVAALGSVEQGLMIVNSRAHALALWRRAKAEELDGLVHLSTRQHARDRRAILASVRARLKDGLPCRVVATSLVEAGVDVDFPRVWRAEAGLDQIVQAAGRCNREGGRAPADSLVTVFRAPEHPIPREIRGFIGDLDRVVPHHADLLGLEAIERYFREVYWRKDAVLDRDGVLGAFRVDRSGLSLDYRKVGENFRLVEQTMRPVIVPIDEAGKPDPRARRILAALDGETMPPGKAARELQGWLVQVPQRAFAELGAANRLRFVREYEFGTQFAELTALGLYEREVGLVWEQAGELTLDEAIV
jgi:CRISPR-associated endonuclease/helicase Cas3